ncbi:hypothetical protein AB670_02570 [Chryseobacterium sp. MOF25P]|uniref:hypothetical protein n=1 Tax=unclassified Chryseobacterium TaxID=2593645 RepID=UPI000805C900|nr:MULTISPECIES: hypothetical protein [unclassified Chryseobacterium]OBW41119.1 hypothetical protein AB670_02570 [Chryseobacterium sp. MOF25P]OBW45751.1 hypothetical protein AB671_02159 [Chryseobacterium sp. BGARF1]
MRNPIKNTKNRSASKFLGLRRKSRLLTERPILSKNFDFLKKNKGTVSSTYLESGIVKCTFSSYSTKRKAFAFGPTFDLAYVNMIKKFNEKYADHGKAI